MPPPFSRPSEHGNIFTSPSPRVSVRRLAVLRPPLPLCDNGIVRFLPSSLATSLFAPAFLALTLATAGCHAQSPSHSPAQADSQTGQQLNPAEQHRVEVLLREKA